MLEHILVLNLQIKRKDNFLPAISESKNVRGFIVSSRRSFLYLHVGSASSATSLNNSLSDARDFRSVISDRAHETPARLIRYADGVLVARRGASVHTRGEKRHVALSRQYKLTVSGGRDKISFLQIIATSHDF